MEGAAEQALATDGVAAARIRRWVPTERLGTLERRIERLGRRATRLGEEPLRLLDLGERRVQDGRDLALVELVGEPPRLAGWVPVAEIHHDDGGNVVRRLAPGVSCERWAQAPQACDHCGLRRRRAVTYVLRHASGTLAQVGTSCLVDFTGVADPFARIAGSAAHAQAVADLGGTPDADGAMDHVPLTELLAHVAASADEFGFVSRSEAERGRRRATYEMALEGLDAGRATPARAHERAEEVQRWALGELRGSDEADGFERRVVAAFELGERVHRDHAPLVAAAYSAWRRARERDSYVGLPGDVVDVLVEVRDVRKTDRGSRFGDVYWHRLRDDDGRELAWFAVGTRLEEGAKVPLRGRVRRHDRFARRAVTVLEHCRVRGRGLRSRRRWPAGGGRSALRRER